MVVQRITQGELRTIGNYSKDYNTYNKSWPWWPFISPCALGVVRSKKSRPLRPTPLLKLEAGSNKIEISERLGNRRTGHHLATQLVEMVSHAPGDTSTPHPMCSCRVVAPTSSDKQRGWPPFLGVGSPLGHLAATRGERFVGDCYCMKWATIPDTLRTIIPLRSPSVHEMGRIGFQWFLEIKLTVVSGHLERGVTFCPGRGYST